LPTIHHYGKVNYHDGGSSPPRRLLQLRKESDMRNRRYYTPETPELLPYLAEGEVTAFNQVNDVQLDLYSILP